MLPFQPAVTIAGRAASSRAAIAMPGRTDRWVTTPEQ